MKCRQKQKRVMMMSDIDIEKSDDVCEKVSDTEVGSTEAVTDKSAESSEKNEAEIKAYEARVKKELFREIMIACACVVAGSILMFLIMMLCMSFSMPLLWGSIIGMVNAALYWLLLYLSKTTVIRIPYIGRMVILVALVIVGLKFDCFYNWAVLIPLAFTKPLAYIFLFIESRKN